MLLEEHKTDRKMLVVEQKTDQTVPLKSWTYWVLLMWEQMTGQRVVEQRIDQMMLA